ncbi:hypothetical protein [Gluconobacter wancherniae]|uniref:hypothetical protein n=1 Tax=Gluconobacter wancherniae TaxID=1307955 RepID=UPI0038D25721
MVGGSGPIELVHVDGHADLGMGDLSWVDVIRHVAKPLADLHHPKRATEGMNLGSWLAYALAAELVSDLTYVYPAAHGDDLPPLYFPGGDREAGYIEMKAYTRAGLPMNGSVADYHELYTLAPDVTLPLVPFRMITLDDYALAAPFSAGLLLYPYQQDVRGALEKQESC